MKPGDHPDFFRLPPPDGRSRESSIVLSREGRFFHDGVEVTHPGMARAFASWIGRHPDDGRYILNNGYDWSYFTLEDAPFFVVSVLIPDEPNNQNQKNTARAPVEIELSDGTREAFDPRALSVGEQGALYTSVKGGAFQARFTRSAQLALGPLLSPADNDGIFFDFAGQRVRVTVASRKA